MAEFEELKNYIIVEYCCGASNGYCNSNCKACKAAIGDLLSNLENEIRADERRKFAEWLEEKDLLTLWHGDDENETLGAEKVLKMYEEKEGAE